MKTVYKITGEKWQEKLKGRELTVSKWYKDYERSPSSIYVNIEDFIEENQKLLTEDEIQAYTLAYMYGGELRFELTDLTPIRRKWLSHNSKLTLLFIVFIIVDIISAVHVFKMLSSLSSIMVLYAGLMFTILTVCALCLYMRHLEK